MKLPFLWLTRPLLFLLSVFTVTGCAIQYFDPVTGTEHLWGIGHLRMKVSGASEGLKAVVTGTDTLGLAAGSAGSERYITFGWQRLSRLHVITDDTAVRLEWPTSDAFLVRVGSELPLDSHRRDNQK